MAMPSKHFSVLIGDSSNGKTRGFEPLDVGSIPTSPKFAALV